MPPGPQSSGSTNSSPHDSVEHRPALARAGTWLQARADSNGTVALLAGGTALLAFRFFYLINYHAVNVLYWDQWDFFSGLFAGYGPWQLFAWQHGPPRLGVGLLFQAAVARLSGWDSRVDSFSIGFLIVEALLVALVLRRRLLGPLAPADIVLPLAFLSTAQWETLVVTPIAAHGAMPLLLSMLYALVWTLADPCKRYAGVVLLNFLLLYTGFGVFMAPVTSGLLAVEAHRLHRARVAGRRLAASLGALALSVVSIGAFLRGYLFMPAVDCFGLRPELAADYLRFAGLTLAGLGGLHYGDSPALATLGGLVLLSALALVLLYHAWQAAAGDPLARRNSVVIAALSGFTLLFAAAGAIGRLCLGLEVAQASRYTTLVIPGFVALYLHVRGLRAERLRRIILAALITLLVLGSMPLGVSQWHPSAHYSRGKQAWKDCYLATENIAECDRRTGFQIYPVPERTRLQDKLNYLKKQHLNLYRDAP